MAWTNLTFAFGSVLTSAKMTQLDDNFDAQARGDAGAPTQKRSSLQQLMLHRRMFDYGDGNLGAITIDASTGYPPGMHQCTTFTVDASQTLTIDHSAESPADYGFLMIVANSSITINGTINLDGEGGTAVSTANGRGIFGGAGGSSTGGGPGAGTWGVAGATGSATDGASQSSAIIALLMSAFPITDGIEEAANNAAGIGGGAGGGGSISAGDGGGVLVLCAPQINVNVGGTLKCNGTAPAIGTLGGGGGGAVILATDSGGYVNSGTVTADGGVATSGGDGGAGWVEHFTWEN